MPPNPDSDSNDDPAGGDSPTPDRDDPVADQPLCRVFGGPTSHRVQFGNGETRPATGLDPIQGLREPSDGDRSSDSPTSHPDGGPLDGTDPEAFRTAGGRAISAVLERRRAALAPILDSLADTCWRGDSPDAADVRAARSQLAELETAIEEYVARACPETEPWESAGEHVPEARLVELLEGSGRLERSGDDNVVQSAGADSDESSES